MLTEGATRAERRGAQGLRPVRPEVSGERRRRLSASARTGVHAASAAVHHARKPQRDHFQRGHSRDCGGGAGGGAHHPKPRRFGGLHHGVFGLSHRRFRGPPSGRRSLAHADAARDRGGARGPERAACRLRARLSADRHARHDVRLSRSDLRLCARAGDHIEPPSSLDECASRRRGSPAFRCWS